MQFDAMSHTCNHSGHLIRGGSVSRLEALDLRRRNLCDSQDP